MNKKFSTLVAALLLSGALSVNAASISIEDFDKNNQGIEFVSGVMTFTKDVTIENYQDYLLIDQDNVTVDGRFHTLKGHIVVTGKNVTIKNLVVKYNNEAEQGITVFDPTLTVNKTAISAYSDAVTITGCTIECSSEFWLANAITVFPKSENAKILIENNTIVDAKKKKDTDFSSAIIIAQGATIGGLNNLEGIEESSALKDFDASKSIIGNTFEECASDYVVANYKGATSYQAVQISLLEDESNASNVAAYLNGAANDASIIFTGTAEELAEALDNTAITKDVAVVCDGANVLFGNAENPDNGQGAVINGVKPAKADIYGYKLIENVTSDYSMLILTNQNGDQYAITADKTTKKATATQITKAADMSKYVNASNALWKMSEGKESDGKYYYKFINQDGTELKSTISNDPSENGVFFPVNNAPYYNGVALNVNGSNLEVNTPAVYFGLYSVGYKALTAGDLKWFESDGFSVTIKYQDSEGDFTKENIAGNPFVGHLTPMQYVGGDKMFDKQANDETEFYLKDAEGNYIVAEKYASNGNDEKQSTFVFKTIAAKDLAHDIERVKLGDEPKYFGLFKAEVSAKYTDYKKLEAIDVLKVKLTENGGWSEIGRLDLTSDEVPTLAASNKTALKPILVSLFSNDIVDWETFLKKNTFYTVEVLSGDNKGRKLATAGDEYRDDVMFVSTYGNDLEGQFAITKQTIKDVEYYVMSNRETPSYSWAFSPISKLYTTAEDHVYLLDGVKYKIAPVKDHQPSDGYVTLADEKDNKFRIGFSSGVFGQNAWFTENHSGKTNHTVGLDIDPENALEFSAVKYDAARAIEEQKDHSNKYIPSDSIYVISYTGYYDASKKVYKEAPDTLKLVSYSFVNQYTEPLVYNYTDDKYESDVYADDDKKTPYADAAKAHEVAQKFALRMDNGKLNLRPVYHEYLAYNEKESRYDANRMYQRFGDYTKVYAGDATKGLLDNTHIYTRTENDLFEVEPVSSKMYRRLANEVDTVSIYRQGAEKSLLYEKTTEIEKDQFVNFLGLENIAEYTDMEPAMLADTAYVRNETYKPQYMLVVDPTIHPAGKYCPICEKADCEHAVDTKAWVEGRYLVNLVDSAKAWDEAHKHQAGNPYKQIDGYYKLGFVQATHRNDSLIIASDSSKHFIGNNDNANGKYAFKYVDTEDESFVIETTLDGTATPGYLRWMNGVIVAVKDIKLADVYNMNEDEDRTPTANEDVEVSEVSIIATNGSIIVKGAAGKTVAISNILGQTIANAVVSSDNETIAVPAGIAVVAVEGEEAVKVVVK